MRPLAPPACLAALLALAACMTDAERSENARVDDAAAQLDASGQRYGDGAVKDGEPVDCIETTRIRSTDVHGDGVIDFELNGGKVYRNVLPVACPSLGFDERFAYKTSISRLCSVDTITVLQSPGLSPGPTCGLGTFQPVKDAPR